MNENFINIKVDREERPDLDRQYMMYVQAITGSGGWPLNVFLTPTLIPFYGGTYFGPREDMKYGRPSFKSVLNTVVNKWKDDPRVLEQSGVQIIEQLKRIIEAAPTSFDHKNVINTSENYTKLIQKSFLYLKQSFDTKFAGFGTSTKFPMPGTVAMLLRYWSFYKDTDESEAMMAKEAREISFATLKQMARGGIHDHVAGGFHRYTVDREWTLPHFEKMLYDQAQLIKLYSEAYLEFNRDLDFEAVAVGAINYAKERLWCPESKAFYSAEDADSFDRSSGKVEEGAFAVWTEEEIEKLFKATGWPEEDLKAFKCHYNIFPTGNLFNLTNDEHLKQSNVLIAKTDIEETAKKFNRSNRDIVNVLRSGRDILHEHRRTVRPYPNRDEKIVTSWNGMMIAALSVAYRVFGNEEYLKMAEGIADFIKTKMIFENEKLNLLLWRSFYDGKVSGIEGFAEDYAWVISGLIELHQVTFDANHLEMAEKLQSTLDALFRDEVGGGYYDGLAGNEGLFRIKDNYDGVEPSANSLVALNCLRLNVLTGKLVYMERFEELINLFAERLDKNPQAMTTLISALIMNLSKPTLLTLIDGNSAAVVLAKVNGSFLPHLLINIISKRDEDFIGQVCQNNVCHGTISDFETLYKKLGI